ncbi:MAG: hypothetical protein RR393_07870, partial [Bacteroidales bacterium]
MNKFYKLALLFSCTLLLVVAWSATVVFYSKSSPVLTVPVQAASIATDTIHSNSIPFTEKKKAPSEDFSFQAPNSSIQPSKASIRNLNLVAPEPDSGIEPDPDPYRVLPSTPILGKAMGGGQKSAQSPKGEVFEMPYHSQMGGGQRSSTMSYPESPAYISGIGNGNTSFEMSMQYRMQYLGGMGDGHHSFQMPMQYRMQYLGGMGDGHHSFQMPMKYRMQYLGGMGDGHHSFQMPMQY